MNTSKIFKIGDKVKFICGYEETSLSFPCCYLILEQSIKNFKQLLLKIN